MRVTASPKSRKTEPHQTKNKRLTKIITYIMETVLKSYRLAGLCVFVACLVVETEWASLLMFQQIALAGVLAFLFTRQQDMPSPSSPELNLELDQDLLEYMEANPFHECTNDTTIIDSTAQQSFVDITTVQEEEEVTPVKKQESDEEDSLDAVILLLKRLTLDDRILKSAKKELKQTPKKKQSLFPIHLDDNILAALHQDETPQTRNAARTPFRDISRNSNNVQFDNAVFSKKSTSANFLVANSSRVNLTGTSNTMTTPQKRAMKATSTPIV